MTSRGSVKLRIELERRIVRTIVTDAIAKGYRLAVSLERGYDVEDMLLGSVDINRIVNEATAGDESHLFIQPGTGDTVKDGSIISHGWVYFVFGNDGWDVVSDYTTNLDGLGILDRANAIAEAY
jgi:hypothetical protein